MKETEKENDSMTFITWHLSHDIKTAARLQSETGWSVNVEEPYVFDLTQFFESREELWQGLSLCIVVYFPHCSTRQSWADRKGLQDLITGSLRSTKNVVSYTVQSVCFFPCHGFSLAIGLSLSWVQSGNWLVTVKDSVWQVFNNYF